MSQDILQREQEYRKINEALQYENIQIMKKFQDVMRKQDEIMLCPITTIESKSITSGCSPKNALKVIKLTASNEGEEIKSEDVGIPDSVDEMGVKGMSRFYRTKIRTLQESYRKLDMEYKFKCDESRKLEKEVEKFSAKSEKWFQAYNTNKTNLSKVENQVEILNSKLVCKQNENSSLKKDIEQLKRDVKSVSLNLSGIELRLTRSLEENDKLRSALKDAKEENKNLKDEHRKEISAQNLIIKNIGKQKNELLFGFKKQSQLIFNLKKQKAYLEASKLANISEKEFLKILDWNVDSDS